MMNLLLFINGQLQEPVQLVGKGLSISWAEWRRAAGIDAAVPQFGHEISSRQPFSDIFIPQHLTALTEDQAALADDSGCQGYIISDNQISRQSQINDPTICRIQPTADLHPLDKQGRGNEQGTIRHQSHHGPGPFGRPVQNIFDDSRTGIGVHPNMHYHES